MSKQKTIISKQKLSNSFKIDERINTVFELLLEGKRTFSIIQDCTKKWNISERQVNNYISKAKKLLSKQVEQNRDMEFAQTIVRYDYIYGKAIVDNNLKAALAALEKKSQLLRLGENNNYFSADEPDVLDELDNNSVKLIEENLKNGKNPKI